MASDVPLPSIEHDPEDLPLSRTTTNTSYASRRRDDRMSLDGPAQIPLPPSSPMKPSEKMMYTFPTRQRHVSPSLNRSKASPAPSPQPASPTLNTKRSMSGLNGGASPASTKGGFRRTSSTLNTTSSSNTMKATPPPVEPPKARTPGSVAKEYFSRELKLHDDLSHVRTIVLVHDSCYGHRFSRPRTSKAALSTIVERPERIRATILGLSAAYVRLGERYAQGKYGPHPNRDVATCSPPPFKIRRTSRSIPLNHPATTHVHGAKWMEELQIMCDSAQGKLALNGKELARPIGYGKDENGVSLPKLHEGDLYLCAESLNALQGCLGGVCDAVDTVFTSPSIRRAFVCIRPPGHHCSSNYPSGFCWLNNVHVGITYAAMNHGLTHAAIIDFDLHHGDGSQNIVWDHNRKATTLPKNAAAHKKTPIGYYSLHDINSYPCEFGDEEKVRNASLCIDNAHGQSIWNVHLESWKSLDDFWRLYETRYNVLLDKARRFLRYHTRTLSGTAGAPRPKAAIFLSAGFDASEWEGEGMQRHKVNVPTDFYARFTADVMKMSAEEDLGVDGRVISVLEGGYSDRALTSGAFSHICGMVGDDVRSHGRSHDSSVSSSHQTATYDRHWWVGEQLQALEARVLAREPPPPAKKKEKGFSNYTSPTESFTLKMTDTARERRSLSAQFESHMSLDPEVEPPPPEVDWTTAAYEFSRIIIPSDRQTLSCRHEDLNAEATKARREPQSTVGLPEVTDEPMQLRDRKARPQPLDAAPARPPSRGDRRRTTIAAVADLPDPGFGMIDQEVTAASTRPRRRSSGASSLVSGLQSMQLAESAAKHSSDSTPQSSRQSSEAPQKAVRAAIVKKPRAPTSSKVAAKGRSSPRKADGSAPPVPRVPSTFTKPPTQPNGIEEIVTDERSSSQARSGSVASVVRADAADSLSTGAKKMTIKLKVKPPENSAANGQVKPEDRPKKIKAPRKPAVPKAMKGPSGETNKTQPAGRSANIAKVSTMPSGQTGSTQVTAFTPEEPKVAPPNDALLASSTNGPVEPHAGFVASDEAGAVPVADASVPVGAAPAIANVIDIAEAMPNTNLSPRHNTDISAAGARDENSDTLAISETPLKAISSALPASSPVADSVARVDHSNIVTNENAIAASASAPATMVKKTKADLPVFTSTSPIPFASSIQGLAKDTQQRRMQDLGLSAFHKATIGALDEDGPDTKKETTRETGSIWDIPETPQR